MHKGLKWFYRIAIWFVAIFLLSHILAKVTIWTTALRESKDPYKYAIMVNKRTGYPKYTTERKQKLFNIADYLLTPAVTTLFAYIAIRLIKTPGIFDEID